MPTLRLLTASTWLALAVLVASVESARSSPTATLPASVGAPWFGELGPGAVRLAPGPGFTIRRPERTWGTPSTVALVQRVLANMHALRPLAHTLAVGDLSVRRGTKITLHRSHQTGRDLDVGFYYASKPTSYPQDFVAATKASLDLPLTWELLWQFLSLRDHNGGVATVFVDYQVQQWLFEYGESIGVPHQVLYETFQYPRGIGAPGAIVRHVPGHLDHFHIRFACHEADYFCE